MSMSAALYQRLRLWSGITSITLNLALVWAATLLAPAIHRTFLDAPLFLLLPAVLIGAQFLLLPFDYLTGHLLEQFSGRTTVATREYFRDWADGVLRFTVAMTAAGLIFALETLRTPAIQGILLLLLASIMVATAVCMLGILPHRQLLAQPPDAAFPAALQREMQLLKLPPLSIVWMRDGETSTVNGAILEFFTPHTVLLSESVAQQLTPREAALMIARETLCVKLGHRWQSLLVAIGWLVGGVAIGWNLPAQEGLQSALLPMAFVSTWCLLGLFLWPSLSRRLVHAADRALVRLSSPSEVAALFARVQSLNATDTHLSPWKRRIFHPIPPLDDRIETKS